MNLSRMLVSGLVVVGLPASAPATTWNVAQTGCSDTTCTPCCTIQAAVERSSGGDVVAVAPGTYIEQVDIRQMFSMGDITLQASGGPGTVLVSPTSGRSLTHAGFDTNTVTVDGFDFTSPDMTCVFLAHSGDVVLQDVTASGCGNHGFEIDATGVVSLDGCAGTGNGNKGIQIDSAASVTLIDCAGSSNTAAGIHVLNVTGSVDLTNPTAADNADYGIGFDVYGPLTITGATVTGNGTVGVWPWASGTVSISGSTITGNSEQGIDLEGLDGVPVAGVTVTDTTVSNNGHGTGDSGFRLRDTDGPVVITNCIFDDNGFDGLSVESSVVGAVEIAGGHANGNGNDGYDLRNLGDTTVTGAGATGNTEKGFAVDSQAVVRFENCVANDNVYGMGIVVDWQDPEPVDEVTIAGCTANGNGLGSGAPGFLVRHTVGPVTVTSSQTNGNLGPGLSILDTAGFVLVRDLTSGFNGGSGVEAALEGGPVTVTDCIASGNQEAGFEVYGIGTPISKVQIHRNMVIGNLVEGVWLANLDGSGPFEATCNDINGNDTGLYLDSQLAVDARWVWWGDPTGPSGQGSGGGDSIYAEPGGTIQHAPWLSESFSSPVSGCPIFTSDFEAGTLGEWDVVVD